MTKAEELDAKIVDAMKYLASLLAMRTGLSGVKSRISLDDQADAEGKTADDESTIPADHLERLLDKRIAFVRSEVEEWIRNRVSRRSPS